MPDTQQREFSKEELKFLFLSKNAEAIRKLSEENRRKLQRMLNRSSASTKEHVRSPKQVEQSRENVKRLEAESVSRPEEAAIEAGFDFAMKGALPSKEQVVEAFDSRGVWREEIMNAAVDGITYPGASAARAYKTYTKRKKEERLEQGQEFTFRKALDNYSRNRLKPKGANREEIKRSMAQFPGAPFPTKQQASESQRQAEALMGGRRENQSPQNPVGVRQESYRKGILKKQEQEARIADRKDAVDFAAKFAFHALVVDGDERELVKEFGKEIAKEFAASTGETLIRPHQMLAEGRELEVALNLLDIVPATMAATRIPGALAKVPGAIARGVKANRGARAAKVMDAELKAFDATSDAAEVIGGTVPPLRRRLLTAPAEKAPKAPPAPLTPAQRALGPQKLTPEKKAQRSLAYGKELERAKKANPQHVIDELTELTGKPRKQVRAEFKVDPAGSRRLLARLRAEVPRKAAGGTGAAASSARAATEAPAVEHVSGTAAGEASRRTTSKPYKRDVPQTIQETVAVLDEAAQQNPVKGAIAAKAAQALADKHRKAAANYKRAGDHQLAKAASEKADELDAGAARIAESAGRKIQDPEDVVPPSLPGAMVDAAQSANPDAVEPAAIAGVGKVSGLRKAGLMRYVSPLHAVERRTGKMLDNLADGKEITRAEKVKLREFIDKVSGGLPEIEKADGSAAAALRARSVRALDEAEAALKKVSEGRFSEDQLAAQRAFMSDPERGAAPTDALVKVFAASSAGAVIGAKIASEKDQNIWAGSLVGGFALMGLAAGAGSVVRAVRGGRKSEAAVSGLLARGGKSLAKGLKEGAAKIPDADYGEAMMAFWKNILPDRIISPAEQAITWKYLTPAVGATYGAGVGAAMNRDRPGGHLAGAAMGSFVFGAMGGVLGRRGANEALVGGTGYNPLRAMRKLVMDAPGSSPNLATLPPEHFATRMRLIRDGYASGFRMRHGKKAYENATEAEKAAFRDYVDNRASLSSLPKHLREPAHHYRHAWEEVQAGLAEVDMPAEDVITELGKFDPKMYSILQNNDDYERVSRYLNTGEKPRRLTPKVFKEMLSENLPPDVRRSLLKIDSDYRLGSSTSISNFEDLSHQLEARRFARYARSHHDLSRSAEAVGEEVQRGTMVNPRRGVHGYREVQNESQRFIELPDNPKYGDLAGRYVDSDLAEDFISLVETPGRISDFLAPGGKRMRSALTTFKRAKVTWNPSTHVRNAIGAFTMTNGTAGVPIFSKVWGQGAMDWKNGTEMFAEARDAGVFGRTFVQRELTELLAKHLQAGDPIEGLLKYFGDAGELFETKVLDRLEDGFEAVEEVNKMILFRHARMKSMKITEAERKSGRFTEAALAARDAERVSDAAAFALKYGYDYDMVNGFVRWSKNSIFGSPFITFAYKAMPRAMEAAVSLRDHKKMIGFWKYPMMMAAVNEISASRLGLLDEQDMDTSAFGRFKRVTLNALGLGIGVGGLGGDSIYQRFAPDYWGSNQVLLPRKSAYGVQDFFDATYYIGWGDIGEMGKGPIGRNLAEFGWKGYPRALEQGHPLLTTFVASITGRDMQTGFPIWDNPGELGKALDSLEYNLGTWVPSWFPMVGRSYQKMERSIDAPPGKLGVLQSAVAVAGLGTQKLQPHHAATKQISSMDSRVTDMKASLNRASRKGKDAKVGRFQKAILKAEKKIDKLKLSKPPMNAKFEIERKLYEMENELGSLELRLEAYVESLKE